jgi:VanZ family protein
VSRRTIAWLPAGAYMLLIWGLSSIPHPFVFDRLPFQDKGAHFIEYGVLAGLMAHAFNGTWPSLRARTLFSIAWAATVFWGLLDEIHQAYVPGRVADALDLLADSLGGLAGTIAYIAYRARRQSARRTEQQQ